MRSLKSFLRRAAARATVALRCPQAWSRLHAGDVCCRVLIYHGVARHAAPDHVAISEFAAQMRWLTKSYQIVSLRELGAAIRGERNLPPRAVALTFDDGYANLQSEALPLLERLGLPCTIFVVPDRVGREAEWSDNREQELTRLLDWDALAAISRAGVEIGSHTLSHADLISLPEPQARREICESRHRIEQRLGCEVTSFCYPWARLSPQTVTWVQEAGYRVGCAGGWGMLHRADSLLRLKRIGVDPRDTLDDFETKLQGGFLFFNLGAQRRTNRASISSRSA